MADADLDPVGSETVVSLVVDVVHLLAHLGQEVVVSSKSKMVLISWKRRDLENESLFLAEELSLQSRVGDQVTNGISVRVSESESLFVVYFVFSVTGDLSAGKQELTSL